MRNWLYVGINLYNLDRFAQIVYEERDDMHCLVGYFEFSNQDCIILDSYDSKEECFEMANQIKKEICI